jgi:hypothetical protein
MKAEPVPWAERAAGAARAEFQPLEAEVETV